MKPAATYRVQFHQGYRFVDGRDLVPYLSELGITDLYSSPRYKAQRGSSHGYDIANPRRINSELGTEEDFDEMSEKLRHYGMGLVLDIVPNHMAASYENPWWTDVLENGPASGYASYFDIDWHPPSRLLDNKVLLPVLGDTYGRVLENQELRPAYRDGSFVLQYFEESFPLSPNSYHLILKHRLDVLERRLGEGSPAYQEYRGIVAALCSLHEREALTPEAPGQRRLQAEATKERLRHLYDSEAEIGRFITENLRSLCGRKKRPASFRPLDRLLAEQAY